MAATSSLSSLIFSNRNSFLNSRNPTTNIQTKSICASSNNSPKLTTRDPKPDSEKRSLAVATGELFLGVASALIRRLNRDKGVVEVELFERLPNELRSGVRERKGKERIVNVVVEEEGGEEVVWEQREKDVEAERMRGVVTSHGFSFSAAGLLFPYHHGVADYSYLIEKGYIKDTTPLAGSSAGAIVCAVVASGATMQEALQATKILAYDCRQKAVLRDILEKFLPNDAHIRTNGRVRVAVTHILWRPDVHQNIQNYIDAHLRI